MSAGQIARFDCERNIASISAQPNLNLGPMGCRCCTCGLRRFPGESAAAPVASLNYLLSARVWRQDHNGSSHRDPGFIDLAMNKKAEVIRYVRSPDLREHRGSEEATCRCQSSRDCGNSTE